MNQHVCLYAQRLPSSIRETESLFGQIAMDNFHSIKLASIYIHELRQSASQFFSSFKIRIGPHMRLDEPDSLDGTSQEIRDDAAT